LVLGRLFHDGPTSRAALARATGLTRVTISDLVAGLLEEGLVEEMGMQRGGVGKPAILVGMQTEAFAIVAVDLSSDAVMRGAVLTLSGRKIASHTADATDCSGDACVDLIEQFVRELVTRASVPVIGVGIGSPGIIDSDGCVLEAPNRDWYNLPLATLLSERIGLPVRVGNDADVAALGEYSYAGAADSMLVITVKQGVGAGLVFEGARVHGSRGAAGEIGHVTVIDDGDLCACGRRGCLETVLAEPALRRAIEGLDPDATQHKLGEIGRILGLVLAPVVSVLNLAEVLLSGPADLLDGCLREQALAVITERTMPATSTGFGMRMAELGDSIVLTGAAGLVLEAQLGVS